MEALLQDELLSDTAWVQELHSPERDGDDMDRVQAGLHAGPMHTEPPLPSGAVLSQRLRAMPRPILPLPWSADDINPAPWRRTVTEWLPGPFMPEQAPDPLVSWPPASNPQDPSARPKTLDIRTLSQAKLLAAARRHNSMFNISDPVAAVLDGVREHAHLTDPQRASHPFTLGGNPNKDEYTRAWVMVMKNGPGPALEEGRKVQIAKPPSAARQSSVEPLTHTTSGPPAPDGSASTQAQSAPAPAPSRAPPPAPPLKVAYGNPTPEQQRFNALLSSFLEVPVKLPLLAPGAQVLDLKRLFMEVSALGGYNAACESNSWLQLASSLQNDSKLAGILKQVYSYYLLPVEEVLPGGIARPARLVEILEAKVREYDALPALRNGVKVRPPFTKVKEAMVKCRESLNGWATKPPKAAAEAARRLKAHRGQDYSQQQQPRQQQMRQQQQQQQEEGGTSAPQQQQQQLPGQEPEPPAAVAAAPALALRLVRHLASNVMQCAHDEPPLQLLLRRSQGLQTAAMAVAATEPGVPLVAAGGAQAEPSGRASSAAGTAAAADGQLPSGQRHEAVEAGVAGGAREGKTWEAAASEPAAVRFTWDEVEPLEALVLSLRQLRAGPTALQQPPPRLKEHYLAQARPGSTSAGADLAAGLTSSVGAPASRREAASEDLYEREDRLPTGKRKSVGFHTPKCGNCRTCNNPTLKKACETNRARLLEGLEPVFMTKEAEQAYQAKKAKMEEQ